MASASLHPASPSHPNPNHSPDADLRSDRPMPDADAAPAELPRWRLRCMWELGSVLNFLHVFRPLLNITGEFTAEDVEAALITPNEILDDVHMPLLKVGSLVVRLELVFPFLHLAVVWNEVYVCVLFLLVYFFYLLHGACC
ncbi:DDT domain-containing protein DDR4 [Zea mays]|uniref:DDT domain-containing protein DDR4 n=1 Tax=Zea mays TaxID=4577 RepID=A0A1D6HV30_MAIZE|nr:DDT domain-containing protein DDR4 [Zea mays]